jgi:hypothetical protein
MTHGHKKIPLIFFRTEAGSERVREWLKGLAEAERRAVGKDLLRAQWRWPVGMPLCRPLGNGLWEIRTDLETKRTARVLLCLYREHLVGAARVIRSKIWHWRASAARSWSNEQEAHGFDHRRLP